MPAQDTFQLSPASPVSLPLIIDSNTPVYSRSGRTYVFSSGGVPMISTFDSEMNHLLTEQVRFTNGARLPMWIEAIWVSPTGAIYGWYHHERFTTCGNPALKSPEIGALVSTDGGKTFRDLGIILTSGDRDDCSAQNGFFAGGNGDFSVMPDRDGLYFYFLLSTYAGDVSAQGIAMARMSAGNLNSPVAAVWKYYNGSWSEPGLGGRVTPIFTATEPWQKAGTDAFWGPSIHWNTYLETYVVLMNRSCCEPGWPQEGVYLTVNDRLDQPEAWTEPVRILEHGDWYPFVLSAGPNYSSMEAGQVVRLFQRQSSSWEIEFFRDLSGVDTGDPDAEPRQPADPEQERRAELWSKRIHRLRKRPPAHPSAQRQIEAQRALEFPGR